jgi:hypothetical protein
MASRLIGTLGVESFESLELECVELVIVLGVLFTELVLTLGEAVELAVGEMGSCCMLRVGCDLDGWIGESQVSQLLSMSRTSGGSVDDSPLVVAFFFVGVPVFRFVGVRTIAGASIKEATGRLWSFRKRSPASSVGLLLVPFRSELPLPRREALAGRSPRTALLLLAMSAGGDGAGRTSSPIATCRRSSRNVHSPSRRSDATCLPVLRMASRCGLRESARAQDIGSIAKSPVCHRFGVVLALGGPAPFLISSLDRCDSAATRGEAFSGRRGAEVGVSLLCSGVSPTSPWTSSRRDSVLVCREPLKTRRCDVFVLFSSAFRRAISSYIHAFEPSSSPSLTTRGDAGAIGLSWCCLCLSSRLFADSWFAHCFFSFCSCNSALFSSSFNSRTCLSCAANAVR